MPAKITRSVTDNLQGKISVVDINRIIKDYISKIKVISKVVKRNPVRKYYSFDLSIDKLKQIIDSSKGADKTKVRINLVQNLPGQMDCSNIYSIENKLSILVCAVSKRNDSLLRVGDYVLADGFIDFGPLNSECCVQGNPPGTSIK